MGTYLVISTLRRWVKTLMVPRHELILEIRLNKANLLDLLKNELLLDEIRRLISVPAVLEREPPAPRDQDFISNEMRARGSRQVWD